MSRNEVINSLLISLVMFLAVTDLQTVAATTTIIANDFGTEPIFVSYSLAAYSVAAVVAALIVRRASPTATAGLLPFAAILYGISSVLTGLAPSFGLFLAARIIAGFAGGFVSVLAITGLAELTPYKRRGSGMTFVSLGYFVAPMVGIPVSTLLVDLYEWRVPFVAIGVLFCLATLLTWRYSDSSLPKSDHFPSFVRRSKVSLRMGVLSAFFVSGSVVGLTTFIGTWLDDSFNATATLIGIVYAIFNLGGLVGGMSGGFVSDRVGKRLVAMSASLLMSICLLALLVSSALPIVVGGLFVVSVASSFRVAPLQALMTGLPYPSDVAAFIASRNIASQLGIGFAILVCGQLYAEFGFKGVAVASALLSLAAWITIQAIVEPADQGEHYGDEMIPSRVVYD